MSAFTDAVAHNLGENWSGSAAPVAEQPEPFFSWQDCDCCGTTLGGDRETTQQLHDFRELLRAVELRGISAAEILESSRSAFSGRLEIEQHGTGWSLHYCAGQYAPTEYRAAACAVLTHALWGYFRQCCPADIENRGQWIRDTARRELGLGIARRWFDW